jgi:lauroyl/myristoyl acyltransferase
LPLFTAICFRVGLGRWRIEVGPEIPTRSVGTLRPPAEIMAEINAAFESAILRDIPNAFWVYDRWRFAKAARAEKKLRARAAEARKNAHADLPRA